MLVRLLYVSRAVDASAASMEQMIEVARERNQARGVTGILVYGPGLFLHVLEGGRRAVSDLFGAIQSDPRHTDVELLAFEHIEQRRFGAWALGLVDTERVNTSTLLKYSEGTQLDPYSVAGTTSMALLEDLVATAAIAGHR